MLDFNQSDFLYYTSVLKSNYRKGVHTLRSILETPDQAEIFARNKGAVSAVLSVPPDAPDKNSDQLLQLLQNSRVADLAAETYLGLYYTYEDLDLLLSDASVCEKIVNNKMLFRDVEHNLKISGKLIATLAGIDCRTVVGMNSIIGNTTSLNAVLNNSVTRNVLFSSTYSLKTLTENAAAINTLASNSAVFTAAMNHANSCLRITNSATAMGAVANNSNAMGIVAGDTSILRKMSGAAAAVSAISGSGTARAALASSTRKSTTKTTINTTWRSSIGKCYLISIAFGTTTRPNSIDMRYTTATRGETSAYNRSGNAEVGAFMDSVEVKTSDTYYTSYDATFTYIPI